MKTVRNGGLWCAVLAVVIVAEARADAGPQPGSQPGGAAAAVAPVEWSRFHRPVALGKDYATEDDWRRNGTILDGRAVKDWLKGFNAMPNGAVVNHRLLHPDYMSDEKLNLWAYLTQSLSGKPVPQTADFNGPLIYRTFVTYRWQSPPYRPPGGTIYRENEPDVYYPQGSDWSTCDVSSYYLNDVWAHVLGWDRGLPQKASHWMDLRAAKMLAMQRRHPDGRMFARGEYDTYPGAEQMMAWLLGDALLALRLDAHGVLGKPANWLGR